MRDSHRLDLTLAEDVVYGVACGVLPSGNRSSHHEIHGDALLVHSHTECIYTAGAQCIRDVGISVACCIAASANRNRWQAAVDIGILCQVACCESAQHLLAKLI